MARPAWLPLAAASFAAIVGGTAAVATRVALASTDATTIAALRYVAGAALFAAVAVPLGARPWRVARTDLVGLLVLGVGQFAVFGWLFTQGYAYIPAARGALILSTMPLLTLLIAAASGQERLTAVKLGGVALGAAGVAIALGERAGAPHPEAWKGDLMLLAAAFGGSLYNVFAPRYLRRYGTLSVTTFGMACGAACFGLMFAAASSTASVAAIDARGWWALAYLATVASAGNFFLWLWALERISPTRAAVTVTLNPLSAALLGALLLGEAAGLQLIAGMALVVVSILVVNRRDAR